MKYDFKETFEKINILAHCFNTSNTSKDAYAYMQAMKKEFEICIESIRRHESIYQSAMVRDALTEIKNEK